MKCLSGSNMHMISSIHFLAIMKGCWMKKIDSGKKAKRHILRRWWTKESSICRMLVPPSNSKDYISIRWTRQSSHQEAPSWPSTRISTCLTHCLTFGIEIAASPTFLVRQQQQQQQRWLIRFSLVPTQALFTSPQSPPTQYSIGIHPSRPSLASPKPSVSRYPWMMITHRRPLRGLPAFVTPSSLCRLSSHRGWLLERRRNVKKRLDKRRIWRRQLRALRSSWAR